MAMAFVWTGLVVISVVYGLLSGNIDAVGNAAIDGAEKAVNLSIKICGLMCLWSGVMEVLKRCGAIEKLSIFLRPVLKVLYPKSYRNAEVMENVSANISANLLGIGNAATPLGIKATTLMSDGTGTATNDICTLVVMNTASIQLIPTTVAALRSAAGCETPFDILPAVWVSSVISVTVGIIAAKLLGRVWR